MMNPNSYSLWEALLPLVSLTVLALIVMLSTALFRSKKAVHFAWLMSILGLVFVNLFLFFLLVQEKSTAYFFGESFRISNLEIFFAWIAGLSTLWVLLFSSESQKEMDTHSSLGDYYSLILFACVGMMSLAFANDLMTLFISLEILSISFYVLAGVHRRNLESNESAIKYLVLGAFSTALLLMGIALVYGQTGEFVFSKIQDSLWNTDSLASFSPEVFSTSVFSNIGLALMISAFLFKVGAFPFQQWVPDVYQGSPTAITALMATAVKSSAFVLLVKTFSFLLPQSPNEFWMGLFSWVCILTMISGTLLALLQQNIKRLIAYSGIAHTGYLILALLASYQLNLDFSPLLFYLFVYIFMTLGAFSIVLGFSKQQDKEIVNLEDLRGLGYRNKFMGFCMAFFFLSMAGIPSTAGFMAKFFVFKQVMESELYVLAFLGILSVIVSVYYYLRVIVFLYLSEEQSDLPKMSLPWNYNLTVLLSFFVILLLGILPGLFFWILK